LPGEPARFGRRQDFEKFYSAAAAADAYSEKFFSGRKL